MADFTKAENEELFRKHFNVSQPRHSFDAAIKEAVAMAREDAKRWRRKAQELESRVRSLEMKLENERFKNGGM